MKHPPAVGNVKRAVARVTGLEGTDNDGSGAWPTGRGRSGSYAGC